MHSGLRMTLEWWETGQSLERIDGKLAEGPPVLNQSEAVAGHRHSKKDNKNKVLSVMLLI